jgi:excisionase family DNA binding protein
MIEKVSDVMKIGELAEYLKLPKQTVYKLAQVGKVPGRKVGRQWRFHKDAIDRWLSENPITEKSGHIDE